MDITLLNSVLSALGIGYIATEHLEIISGQRKAYLGADAKGNPGYVIKICPSYPISVARIQREISILSGLHSEYFPKLHFHSFITQEILDDMYDNLDPKKDQELLARLKDANLQPFLITVEEFIENIKWSDCILELKQAPRLVSLLMDLFTAMNLLWDAKIVHRDLKPENILIRPTGKPVIIDLGIAKSFKEGTKDLTGVLLHTPCTPRYAAPEQLFNNRADITYKTDQFSIGVIAFYLLTGFFPYGDVEMDSIEQVLENIANTKMQHAIDANINTRLQNLVIKLLQVEPYKRFRTTENILDELCKIKEELGC